MTTIIVPVYRYLNKKIKGLLNLKKIAKDRNLSFSANDHIAGNIIALDPARKKLLHAKHSTSKSTFIIIDLNDVEICSVEKQYSDINVGDLNKKKVSDFLKSIFLNLRFRNRSRSISLPLFESGSDANLDVQNIELKARAWQLQISKLLEFNHHQRA